MTKALCTAVSAAALALACNADSVLATSTNVAFRIDTTGPVYFAGSQEAASSMWPTTWRKGETVTVTDPQGNVTEIVSDASADGSLSVALGSGGVWLFSNSVSGNAVFGVPWSVYGDGGELASGTGPAATVDTVGKGPDRRIRSWKVLPIAYSGDLWLGDAGAESVLTMVAPSGKASEVPLTGTGCHPFSTKEYGQWHLELDNGVTTLSSDVTLLSTAFCVSIR